MYKHGALVLIAAMVMATVALAIPATTVSAAHTTTATIDKSLLKGGAPVILTITVNNAGPAAINEVKIILPSGFDAPMPLVKIPKDNLVQLPSDDNVVVLLAGTLVQVYNDNEFTVPENTVVIRENGTWVYVPSIGDNVLLTDNARVKLANDDNVVLEQYDNVALVDDKKVTLLDNDLRLLEDLLAKRLTANTVMLPSDIVAEVVDSSVNTGDNFDPGDNLLLKMQKIENLNDNHVTTVSSVTGLRAGVFEVTIGAGVSLQLRDDNAVVLSPDTRVVFTNTKPVYVPENTDVKVEKDTVLTIVDTSAVENQPVNWTQENNASERSVTWRGIGDNKIASGGSLSFPFATVAPNASGTYTIYVRTKDTAGSVYQTTVTVTVDATSPSIENIEISPRWAKENTRVTITIRASESLAKLENVWVAENNGTPVQVTDLTPSSDNKVWTGTYTTSDNLQRDGVATVHVVGAQYEDLVGNKGVNKEENFYVDRMKPPTPNVQSLFQPLFPSAGKTNVGTWLLEGHASDNYRNVLENVEGMTVKIRVGTSTYEVKSVVGGYFHYNLTLTEGISEIGVRYVDLAGNEGDENVENITYDATKPSVQMVSISGKSYTANMVIGDNTPSFVLRISDAIMGVENDVFDSTDNSGYIVCLCRDDNTPIATLEPKSAPDRDPFFTFNFENDYPTELADNWYKINVAAGDNLQSENVYFRFRIDTIRPDKPPTSPTWNPLATTSLSSPLIVVSNTMVLRGEGAEANARIKIYIKRTDTGATLSTDTTPTDEHGNWSKTITLPLGGEVLQIEVTCIDEAGNESDATLYGFVLLDGSAPSVTISAPCSAGQTYTTSEATVVVSGSITKDTWETYNTGTKAVTATIQVGSATPGLVTIGSDGSFSVSAALIEGTNTITIRAVDSAGNGSSATITVVRTATPWATYAIIIVIIALILAAIAIFRKK